MGSIHKFNYGDLGDPGEDYEWKRVKVKKKTKKEQEKSDAKSAKSLQMLADISESEMKSRWAKMKEQDAKDKELAEEMGVHDEDYVRDYYAEQFAPMSFWFSSTWLGYANRAYF